LATSRRRLPAALRPRPLRGCALLLGAWAGAARTGNGRGEPGAPAPPAWPLPGSSQPVHT